jgi:UDP-N-acetylglucosamine 4,6-dehydratase/5-epimerase
MFFKLIILYGEKMTSFTNKVILITGGTGSFGNAFINRILVIDVKEIRVFSRDEKKQDDMRKKYNDSRLKFYIGDVRDYNSIDTAMIGVDFVFHAAALKQVPSAEFFPLEAVKTNIIGSENVIQCAMRNHVERVIFLSTDKAAYPINAMGISKAMMERVVLAAARTYSQNKTSLIITRYGNVIASRGSVIPLFFDQIEQKSMITVTDPAMTRFLMTLEEAIELVIFAFEKGNNGDLFVKKSPAAKVSSIAKAVIIISGKQVEIRYIGSRHSEKQHETLLTIEESLKAIDMGNYFCVPMDTRDLNYSKFDEAIGVEQNPVSYSSDNVDEIELTDLIKLIQDNTSH